MYWNNSGLFFHFAVSTVLLCPGRGIAHSTVQEVLLAPCNNLSAFLAGVLWQSGRRKKTKKTLKVVSELGRTVGGLQVVMLYAAMVMGAGTFLVALSTEREFHFTTITDIWISQRLFCFYVFSRPLILLVVFEFIRDFRNEPVGPGNVPLMVRLRPPMCKTIICSPQPKQINDLTSNC